MSSKDDPASTNQALMEAQIAALQAQLAASEKARGEAESRVVQAEARASTAEAELQRALNTIKLNALSIEKLKIQLARLKREKFGQSSERMNQMMDQLELSLEDLEAEQGFEQARVEALVPATKEKKKRKPKREPLPKHLPRNEVHHDAPDADGCACGGIMGPLGEDVTEILEYTPAQFHVVRHVRPKLACKSCDLASAGARHGHSRRPCGSEASGPCDCLEICRPSAALSPVQHLQAFGRRSQPINIGGLGGSG